MRKKSSPDEPELLPVKLGPTTNGEFFPEPKSDRIALVQRLAFERADANARRLGIPRRDFLRSTCGTATVLLTMNQILGCGGAGGGGKAAAAGPGGSFALPNDADLDRAAADAALTGDELIFDVQTHHVATDRPWAEQNEVMRFLADTPQADCGREDWVECYRRDEYIKEIFLDSDTDLAVLSMLPGPADALPLTEREAAETRERVSLLEGSPRLRIHGVVLPNAASDARTAEHMQSLVETWDVAAWKLYTLWGPDGTGYFLDDEEVGIPVIERAVELGVPMIAVHKGLPLPTLDPTYTRPRDMGPVAARFPNVQFLVYHSGYETGHREGPYDPDARRGIDALIRSLEQHDVPPDANVWAELGSTWRHLMRKPHEAAHALGKLMKHVGEDRVLWGTDAIWYGSPQDQIEAFRAFEISDELQERHGYPALTPERKAKILGLNGARVYGLDPDEVRRSVRADDLSKARRAYRSSPSPSHLTRGPRSRREVLALWRWRGGYPD